jgi:hypothetical protein
LKAQELSFTGTEQKKVIHKKRQESIGKLKDNKLGKN